VGLFLHISSNIIVEGGLFADNGVGIDLERTISPAIQLSNIKILGESQSFRDLVSSKGLDDVCHTQYNSYDHNVGIEMRTWKNEIGDAGSVWENIDFSGFNHSSCKYSQPISLDYTVSHFDEVATFSRIVAHGSFSCFYLHAQDPER
jgi:hypothetical protein